MTSAVAGRSAVAERSAAFVEDRRSAADALGRELAELVGEPDAFTDRLLIGFESLSDPSYLAEQERVAPGLGSRLGVRLPLIGATQRSLRQATKGERASTFLWLVDRLLGRPELEIRIVAFGLLGRLLRDDPERGWQLIRRAARQASDWITVDELAHSVGRGILLEPYRWAELEQLVYSPSRWERRLVAATIATLPHIDHRAGRDPAIAGHALPILANLMGDADPDVQKALSWALRSLVVVDGEATTRFCEAQAQRAQADADGHRSWVLRDTLVKLPPQRAAAIRSALAGIRRKSDAPSTSDAAAIASRFGALPDPVTAPEPPLT